MLNLSVDLRKCTCLSHKEVFNSPVSGEQMYTHSNSTQVTKYAFFNLPPVCLCRVLSKLPDLCKIPSLRWSFFIYLGK